LSQRAEQSQTKLSAIAPARLRFWLTRPGWGSRVLKEPQTTRRAKGAIRGLRFGNRIFPVPANSGTQSRIEEKENPCGA